MIKSEFWKVFLKVINLGENTDIIAAILGGIAGIRKALVGLLTLILSIAAGMTVSKVGTKYILKDGLGNTVMELDEVVEGGLKINYNVLNTLSADDVNAIFKNTMG